MRLIPRFARCALLALFFPMTAGALETTTLTIAASGPSPSEFGQGIAVRFALTHAGSGMPTGTITLSDGSDGCTATLPEVTCLYLPASSGAKLLTAQYSGDATFAASTSRGEPHQVAAATFPRRVSIAQPAVNFGTPTGAVVARAASADFRFVAMLSYSRQFVAGDVTHTQDVVVFDRASGEIEVISKGPGGEPANGNATAASLSADGRFVAFVSSANNLVAGDANGFSDVFLYDRDTDTLSLVSAGPGGVAANHNSSDVAISADGRYLAYASAATNLTATPVPNESVYVYDRVLGHTEIASVSSDGTPGNIQSRRPAISADGRHVAFQSFSNNLVPDDTNNTPDVFVRDRQTGTTERVSVSASGVQANDSSQNPTLSADGRYIAFDSFATNLVSGDTVTRDVFVRDRQTGSLVRASVTSAGIGGNGASLLPQLSGDGRYLAFSSDAANLVAGDTNGDTDTFRRDLQTATTTRVSVSSLGAQSSGDSLLPLISGDGRQVMFETESWSLDASDLNDFADSFVHDTADATTRPVVRIAYGTQAAGRSVQARISGMPAARQLAFTSNAANLVPGDVTPLYDAFVRALATGATERVSVASDGGQANSDGYHPQLSSDARYAAFYSYATNIAGGNPLGIDVFVRDRATSTTELASVNSAGEPGNSQNSGFAFSGNGRYVAIHSTSTNLVAGDTNGVRDIFLRDRLLGTTTRISVSSAGAQANGASIGLAISEDGNAVAFTSDATNLIAGDTNGATDIFVRDVAAGTTELISRTSAGAVGNGISTSVAISPNGRYVAFSSAASNLVTNDTNGVRDVFLYDRQTQAMRRASIASGGIAGNGASDYSEVSDSGLVVFSSAATNLVTGDTNAVSDVFVHEPFGGATARLSITADSVQGNGPSDEPSITGDGRDITFHSEADNLVAGDTNGASDIFLVRNPLIPTATATQITQQQPATSVVGQPYLVTVSVTADDATPVGSVTISDGQGASCVAGLSGGSGSCTLTSFTAGSLSLDAQYSSAVGFGPSSATAPRTVARANTIPVLSATPSSGVSGQTVTLRAELSASAPGAGVPDGVVYFADDTNEIGSATLSNGVATLNHAFTAGTHSLAIAYIGSANYNGVTAGPVTLEVAPAAALGITLDDARDFVAGGSALSYTLTVLNTGPDTAAGARVRNTLPVNFVGVAWSCTASGGGHCGGAGGNGAIDALVDLPSGASVAYTITGTVQPDPEQPLVHTASVEAPAGIIDPISADNSASDTTEVGLFADGFEAAPQP